MVERDRWQARLAIRSYAGAMAGRLVCVLLFVLCGHIARKCAVRPVPEPVFHTPLLDRPSGRTEGDIRRGQDDLGAHVTRWRGLGRSRTS